MDKWNAFPSFNCKTPFIVLLVYCSRDEQIRGKHQMPFAVSAKANELSGNSYTFKLTKEEIIEFV